MPSKVWEIANPSQIFNGATVEVENEYVILFHSLQRIPYPEPVYTGWSSVHWNATGWPSVHWDTTEPPSEYLRGTLEHQWKNLVETAQHWNATGET